jgi:hypothetical protein
VGQVHALIAATLTLDLGYEAPLNERGERLIWLDAAVVDYLTALRRPGERATSSCGWWSWRRRAQLNPSLTMLPHRHPSNVSWDEWQWLF